MTVKHTQRYIAFLRGINVGGHHKVQMVDLKKEMKNMGFENVITLLNSGNTIFESSNKQIGKLEELIANKLEKKFGFSIPTIVILADTIEEMFKEEPFQKVELTKDTRFYVTFLKKNTNPDLALPWVDDTLAFSILEVRERMVLSVLDISVSKTPKAMKVLAQFFGKDITTRTWKTIARIVKKL